MRPAVGVLAAGLLLFCGCTSPPNKPRADRYDWIQLQMARWAAGVAQQNPDVMRALADEIHKGVEPEVRRLMRDARTAPVERRILAVFGLGFSKNREVVPTLTQALGDDVIRVRMTAIGSFGILLWQKVIAPEQLPAADIPALLTDDAEVVHATLATLGFAFAAGRDLGQRDAVKKCLTHGDPLVRGEAVRTLRMLGDPSLFDDLAPLAGDPDPLVRIVTASALAGLDSKRAVPIVYRLLNDHDADVVVKASTLMAAVAPRGFDVACRQHGVVQAPSGKCPTCGRPVEPRPR